MNAIVTSLKHDAATSRAPSAAASGARFAAASQPTLLALRQSRYFETWPQPALAALSLSSSLRSFSAGQVLAPQGKPMGSVLLVVKGRLRAAHRAADSREVTLDTFREGDLVLESVFDANAPLSHEIVAASTTLVMHLPRAEFLAQLEKVADGPLSLARELERRLARSRALAAGLAVDDVEQRLLRELERLGREEGDARNGDVLVSRCPTQQELASRIGACRETVSRIVAALARAGKLSLHGRRLTLSASFFTRAGAA